MAKTNKKAAEAAGPVVYCGPTIPGVAKQFTVYTGGTPDALTQAIRAHAVLGAMVVHLERLPEAMRQLQEGSGPIYNLYRKAQEIR